MLEFRTYGKEPFCIAVVHGGPGAKGEMKPVANELSKIAGIIEPLQTKDSVVMQLEELKQILQSHSKLPVVLIGYSWGAWLSFLFASRFPGIVKKLILVGSGPFEDSFSKNIMETRLSRLQEADRMQANLLIKKLEGKDVHGKNEAMIELGELISLADSFNPIRHNSEIEFSYDIYSKVWDEAELLRKNKALILSAKNIKCPLVAIHGAYDPHPVEGVKILSSHLKDFRFITLEKCGHTPWIEKNARDRFYSILIEEMELRD